MVLLSQLKHQAEVPGATLYNIRRAAANCHHIHTHALANYYPLNTWRTLLLRASDRPPDPLTNLRTTPDLAVHLPLVQLTPIATINNNPFPTQTSAEIHRPFQVKNVKTRLLPLLPPPKAPLDTSFAMSKQLTPISLSSCVLASAERGAVCFYRQKR